MSALFIDKSSRHKYLWPIVVINTHRNWHYGTSMANARQSFSQEQDKFVCMISRQTQLRMGSAGWANDPNDLKYGL